MRRGTGGATAGRTSRGSAARSTTAQTTAWMEARAWAHLWVSHLQRSESWFLPACCAKYFTSDPVSRCRPLFICILWTFIWLLFVVLPSQSAAEPFIFSSEQKPNLLRETFHRHVQIFSIPSHLPISSLHTDPVHDGVQLHLSSFKLSRLPSFSWDVPHYICQLGTFVIDAPVKQASDINLPSRQGLCSCSPASRSSRFYLTV